MLLISVDISGCIGGLPGHREAAVRSTCLVAVSNALKA